MRAIFIELAQKWLSSQGTSTLQLLSQLMDLVFEIVNPDQETRFDLHELKRLGCAKGLISDVVAVHTKHSGSTVDESLIRCS